MTISAPPRPLGPGDPVDRDELEAIVNALIEEARQRARRRRRIYGAAAALVALTGVAVFAVFERNGAAESRNASPAPTARSAVSAGSTPSKIAFVLKERGVKGDTGGTFTLIGAVSDSGTSHVIGNTSSARPLLGDRVYKGRAQGPGQLDGRKGDLSFWWSGSFVSVNASTVITTGVWRIGRATGVYKTWKGGGTFVDVGHQAPSIDNQTPSAAGTYEARFEGRVKR